MGLASQLESSEVVCTGQVKSRGVLPGGPSGLGQASAGNWNY